MLKPLRPTVAQNLYYPDAGRNVSSSSGYGEEEKDEDESDQHQMYQCSKVSNSFDITDTDNLLGKRKRHRRTALEIERSHACQVCGKSYGSEGSLSQHVKLKHPQQAHALLTAIKVKS